MSQYFANPHSKSFLISGMKKLLKVQAVFVWKIASICWSVANCLQGHRMIGNHFFDKPLHLESNFYVFDRFQKKSCRNFYWRKKKWEKTKWSVIWNCRQRDRAPPVAKMFIDDFFVFVMHFYISTYLGLSKYHVLRLL